MKLLFQQECESDRAAKSLMTSGDFHKRHWKINYNVL